MSATVEMAIAGDAAELESVVAGKLLCELREFAVRLARHFGARQAAEDVAQEAMMAYLAAEDVAAPHAWLRTVVRRLVSLRHRDPHVHDSLDNRPGADRSRATASTADQVILFRQVLGLLPARDRRILMLKLRGYSYGEMAERLGCRPSAVGTTVNRTFVRVRRLVERGLQ